MSKKLINIAVSGITNYKDFIQICQRIEGDTFIARNNPSKLSKDSLNLIYYTNDDMYFFSWREQDYEHCTLYTVAEFKNKFMKPPLNFHNVIQDY